MGWIEDLARQVESAARKAMTEARSGGGLPPELAAEGITAEDWARLTPEQQASVLAARGLGPADPFGDQAYKEQGGSTRDAYSLDFAGEVENQQYRAEILREDRGGFPGLGIDSAQPGAPGKISAHDYVARVMAMSPEELEAYQRKLFAAGFYGPVEGQKSKKPIWGAPDEQTVMATKLLAYTTMRFKGTKTINEVLDLFTRQNDTDGDGTPDGGADSEDLPTIRLTNPLDVQAGARQVSQEMIGRGDRGFVQSAPGAFNALEAGAQRAVMNDQVGGGGGTVTDAPNVGAFLEDKMLRENATEVDAYQVLGTYNAILQALGVAG